MHEREGYRMIRARMHSEAITVTLTRERPYECPYSLEIKKV